jgi:Fur family ferric uptake transcriptional regulator
MNFKEQIQQCGLKATPGRLALLEHLYKSDAPLCYEQVKVAVTIDKATFYRTMATFEANGIVDAFEFPDNRRHYEYHRHPHAHFICSACGGVECLKQSSISLPNYKIETIVIKGTCPACNA